MGLRKQKTQDLFMVTLLVYLLDITLDQEEIGHILVKDYPPLLEVVSYFILLLISQEKVIMM